MQEGLSKSSDYTTQLQTACNLQGLKGLDRRMGGEHPYYGKRAVVKKQIGGNSTIEAVRVPELSHVLLLGPLTGRVGAIVEQLLTSQGRFAGPQILHPLRNGGALGRRGGP
jgi:hypothetical protein